MSRPAKLSIFVERAGTQQNPPVFDTTGMEAQFNPEKLAFNKTANWEKQDAKNRNAPELQYKNSEPRTLTIDLIFDTYDSPLPMDQKDDVRTKYTDNMLKLISIDPQKHRPPVCKLMWCGKNSLLLQGILKTLGYQFTLFTELGIPVRARLNCSFMEWTGNIARNPPLQSSDLAKIWIVKRGDTLSGIASREYGNCHLWRPIAEANDLDDPLALMTGMELAIPSLPYKRY